MQVIISKGELWDLLGDKAITFASFLETAQGASIKIMLMTVSVKGRPECLDLNSPLIQDSLLPMLLSIGVIDQAVIDRVNARVTQETTSPPPSSTPPKTYRVDRPSDIQAWKDLYAPTAIVIEGVAPNQDAIFVTGDCTDPSAEVI